MMSLININTGGASGFLYNSGSGVARLCVTSETPEFDNSILGRWKDEGFDVVYIAYNNGGKEYMQQLRSVKEGLGVGENYAIVAYGDAATYCLDYFQKPPNSSRLCALVAYYPTAIPDTRMSFPHTLRVQTHLAGKTVDVTTVPTALGLQGKKKRITRQIKPGIGAGERLNIGHPAYTYTYVKPGFAETDLDEYDRLAAELAWSRTMHVLRKGFGKDLDLEAKWEEHLDAKFFSSDLSSTMDKFASHVTPTVTYTPTLCGGIGQYALRRFYEQHFLRKLPPSMKLRLISRTIGVDRIVDELYASFEHTQEIPWMLPGVPATNKMVEIVLISIVTLRAGKLYSEHVYWDQASVLVQVGLLDPKLVPQSASTQGLDRLPVMGREAARRMLREDPETEEEYHNRLIRRARAKGKERHKSRAGSVVEESGTEAKVEAGSRGKSIQRSQPAPEGIEERSGEEADTETPAVKEKNMPIRNGHSASATVEDEPGGDD